MRRQILPKVRRPTWLPPSPAAAAVLPLTRAHAGIMISHTLVAVTVGSGHYRFRHHRRVPPAPASRKQKGGLAVTVVRDGSSFTVVCVYLWQVDAARFELEVRRRLGQDCSDLIDGSMRRQLVEERANLIMKLNKIRERRAQS